MRSLQGGALPPIPAIGTQHQRAEGAPNGFVCPLQSGIQSTGEIGRKVQGERAATANQAGEGRWTARHFIEPITQPQKSEDSTTHQPAINQDPRSEEALKLGPVAQPSQRSGVVQRLQSKSSVQINKKFMEASEPIAQMAIDRPRKKAWFFSLLGTFALCGLGAGGFFFMKTHEVDAEEDGSTTEQFVSDHRSR